MESNSKQRQMTQNNNQNENVYKGHHQINILDHDALDRLSRDMNKEREVSKYIQFKPNANGK